jgi:hypothetical protein
MNPHTWHQPAADEGADDADGHVANQAEAAALDNLAGESTGNDAHKQNNQKTFASDVHCATLSLPRTTDTSREFSRLRQLAR